MKSSRRLPTNRHMTSDLLRKFKRLNDTFKRGTAKLFQLETTTKKIVN